MSETTIQTDPPRGADVFEEVKQQEQAAEPARSGACPFCMRKHLLKAKGYVAELAEDQTREWEREKLLENLLLAEDHAEEFGDLELRASIRAVRMPVESGKVPVDAVRALYDNYIHSPRWTDAQKNAANAGGGEF